jgi:glycosyltransferase involved in cell wall biosynthesis
MHKGREMKLQILVPHYNESVEDVKPLLDSIALQQSVDFAEVGVIICHDGEDIERLELPEYPYKVEQIWHEHKGVSATRNACLDHAVADYVMFCDCDDMFMNVCGLYIVFREFEQGFDSLLSVFMEETRHPQTKEILYTNHDMDSTFVHGKVHRRQYLLDNNIRWDDRLTIHEDSYFNILCQNLSTNVKYCQVPFYLWKWRDNSVCRHDPKYILKTYRNMLDSNDSLIDAFLSRGRQDKAMFYTAFMTFDAYYTMNKPDWINQENREYRDSTERRFSEWFDKHEDLWDAVPITDKMAISNQVRARSINEGMQMEAVTVDGWLKHIKGLRR